MKLLVIIFAFFITDAANWTTDFPKAKTEAAASHKFILLNFSGSDWCVPCIRLHEDVFGDAAFTTYAGENLVLVNADFPRMKKNKLLPELQHQNDSLAAAYNPEGVFPLTILLTPEGKTIKSWEGNTKNSGELITEIKTAGSSVH